MAARDVQLSTRYPTGIVQREEHGHLGDIVRLAGTAERGLYDVPRAIPSEAPGTIATLPWGLLKGNASFLIDPVLHCSGGKPQCFDAFLIGVLSAEAVREALPALYCLFASADLCSHCDSRAGAQRQ